MVKEPPETGEDWSDAALALRCAARESAAWEELLRRTGAVAERVMGRVFRRAGVPDPRREAAEAMGAVVVALLERDGALLRAYRPAHPLKTYLAVVARSVAHRALRGRPPCPRSDVALDDLAWAGEDALPTGREELEAALAGLPPRDRLMLRLVYWEGLGQEETARILGLKPGSLGPLMTRSRAALRDRLQDRPSGHKA